MFFVGEIQDGLSLLDQSIRLAVMNGSRGEQLQSGVMMPMVIPVEELLAEARASSMEPKRSGYSGRYFIVLKWASENGLSSQTWGRLWVLTMPRSANSRAKDFEVIEEPRSA